MFVAKDAIVTPDRVAKAKAINSDGVRRLALFALAASETPADIYLACQRMRNEETAARRRRVDMWRRGRSYEGS